jgi:hypothetical protein
MILEASIEDPFVRLTSSFLFCCLCSEVKLEEPGYRKRYYNEKLKNHNPNPLIKLEEILRVLLLCTVDLLISNNLCVFI